MRDFFEKPPRHAFEVGDLVTCSCHGQVAVVLELYDIDESMPMNMARIWWLTPPDSMTTNLWMHTIKRLKKYTVENSEITEA